VESDKWCLKGLLRKMVSFSIIYTEKEQIAGPKNDHAMRKAPEYISSVKDLGFILCKKDPPNLYKLESAL
jgi:hypothetical protein